MTRSSDLALAIDVGGTTIKAEIVDAADTVIASSATPTPRGAAAVDAIADAGQRLRAELTEPDRVTAAAVGIPGIVDRDRAVGVLSGNVGWRDVAIGEPLHQAWDLPVAVDHDVTLAGWAEWRAGAGRGVDDVCFVSLGTGVAATLIVDGRLVRGGIGQGGELGHVPSRDGDRPCGCGARGCLETIASATAIEQSYAQLTGTEHTSAEQIVARRSSDCAAQRVWDDAVTALADGLIHLIHAVSPRRIVLGGGLSAAGTALTDPLYDALAPRLRVVAMPDVVAGAFTTRAGIVGVAMLARTGSTDNEA